MRRSHTGKPQDDDHGGSLSGTRRCHEYTHWIDYHRESIPLADAAAASCRIDCRLMDGCTGLAGCRFHMRPRLVDFLSSRFRRFLRIAGIIRKVQAGDI
jgi:hypothetical protein